jgi:hypothetical protein
MKTRQALLALQRQMAQTVMQPLNRQQRMQKGTSVPFIKPNDRLTAFERLEIYNRQYWFRVRDCLYEDFPGLRAVVGETRFARLAEAYLEKHPSRSFTLRNLGRSLAPFLQSHPSLTRPYSAMAVDMVRLEWAFIEAFDGEELPALSLTTSQAKSTIQLRLQPYLSLLALRYPLDDFLIEWKRTSTDRQETSNASRNQVSAIKKIRRPRPQKVYVAVHRRNELVFYKRLARPQFLLLTALQAGLPLAQALHSVPRLPSTQIQAWFQQWSEWAWFIQPSSKKSS